jgi:hypothetical protein
MKFLEVLDCCRAVNDGQQQDAQLSASIRKYGDYFSELA